jgi:hypothetical protein
MRIKTDKPDKSANIEKADKSEEFGLHRKNSDNRKKVKCFTLHVIS